MKLPELIRFKEVSSTMDVARRLAMEGRDAVVVAEVQTKGRGRRGRSWMSPKGGLFFTLIHPSKGFTSEDLIPLASGVAVVLALNDLYGLKTSLKWPNDVLFRERKLCGVLIEAVPPAEKVLVGVGINANNPIPETLKTAAVSLKELLGHAVDLEELLEVVLRRLLSAFGWEPLKVVSEWKRWAETLGRPVKVLTPEGEVVGIARDVSVRGELLVETEEGLVSTSVGDCVHLR